VNLSGGKVELTGKTFGEVIAQETLAQTPVVKVLRGIENGSRLPVLVFVFDRDLESLSAQRWAQARSLRARAPVMQIAIINAQQTAELFFVSVAWNPQTTTNVGTLPPRLVQIIAWLESSCRDDLGVRVTDVLRALENLEPRAVARTMMLEPDGKHVPAASSDSNQATPNLPVTNPRRTTTLTASPVELSDFNEFVDAKPTSRKWLVWGAGLGVAAAAIVGFSFRGEAPTIVASVAALAPPVAAIAPPPPPPIEAPAPPAAPEATETQMVLVASRPAGATVCDPKTDKILGKTPLKLPSSQFEAGYKLLLTRAGSQFRTFRWPADHAMTLKRLGADEAQPLSPCSAQSP